jgi:hypothetical protein
VSTVRRWIRRAKPSGEYDDHARSGRPAIYPPEVRRRIVAFYCQTQPLPGGGRWTLRWAERRLKVDPTAVGGAPSKSTLQRILQSNRLKPHPSPRGYPFCRRVAELSGTECPPELGLSSQAKRVEWLAREDKRIVIHFTPYHGSGLNWTEFWFAIRGRKVLGESFGSPDEFKAALEAFANDWNTLLAHPFHWSYNGSGLHEKAGQRFTKMLCRSAAQMELRILTQQMMLLTNRLSDYVSEVSRETWEQFAAVRHSQTDTISELIQGEEGPRRKHHAQQAVTRLNEALREYFVPSQQSRSLRNLNCHNHAQNLWDALLGRRMAKWLPFARNNLPNRRLDVTRCATSFAR